MKNILNLWLFVGFLFIGISIPLILEQVPPNNWYGLRVAKTLSNEINWYAANRVAGYDLLWAGIAIAITAVITRLFVARLGENTAYTINFLVFLGALLLAVVHSFLNLNQL
jgi:uncharacterized membrane protein